MPPQPDLITTTRHYADHALLLSISAAPRVPAYFISMLLYVVDLSESAPLRCQQLTRLQSMRAR